MSTLNANRKEFIDYLRTGFGHGQDYTGNLGPFTHQQVMDALKLLSKTDPASWALLHTWMTTRLDLRGLSGRHNWPEHTLRRRIHASVDAVLAALRMEDYRPIDTDHSVMSGCEIFHEVLLQALEQHHPGIGGQITRAIRAALNAKRRGQSHG